MIRSFFPACRREAAWPRRRWMAGASGGSSGGWRMVLAQYTTTKPTGRIRAQEDDLVTALRLAL